MRKALFASAVGRQTTGRVMPARWAMREADFEVLLHLVERLGDEQGTALGRAWASAGGEPEAVRLIEQAFAAAPRCPHCGAERLQRWGDASGLRRYRCQACRKTFNALTGTSLARLRKKACWLRYGEALAAGMTLARAAAHCGVHLTTSFRWRHRFLRAPAAAREALGGVVEADETFFRRSHKGSRRWRRGDAPPGRGPRRRGERASKRGRRIPERTATGQAKRIWTSLPSSLSKAWSGVRKPRHFRGVRLWLRMISCSSASLMASRSRSRGRSRRSRPFAFSTAPFCHDAYASQNQVAMEQALASRPWRANAVSLSKVIEARSRGSSRRDTAISTATVSAADLPARRAASTKRVLRSSSTSTGRVRLQSSRSPSQCPGSFRSWTSAGRSWIERRPAMVPRACRARRRPRLARPRGSSFHSFSAFCPGRWTKA